MREVLVSLSRERQIRLVRDVGVLRRRLLKDIENFIAVRQTRFGVVTGEVAPGNEMVASAYRESPVFSR